MTIEDTELLAKRAADRERQRKHRHKALGPILEVVQCDAENVTPDLGSASGVRALLNFAGGKLIREADLTDGPTLARAVGTLAGAALKLLEVSDLVERLESLEEAIQRQEGERK